MTTASVEAGEPAGVVVVAGSATQGPLPETMRAARAVTTVGLLQLSVLLVMLVRSKLLAMLLHPDGVGIVSTLDQLVQFIAQVSALSLIAAPTRFLARTFVDGLEAATTMYSALLKLLLLSLCIGTAIAAGVLALGNPLGAGMNGYEGIALVAALTAPMFALSGFIANVSAVASGYSRTSVFLLINAVASLAGSVIGLRLFGIAGLYYGNLVALGACTLGLAIYLSVAVPLKFAVRRANVKAVLRQHPDIVAYCSTTYVLAFAQPLAFLLVRAMTLKELGSAETGYFQAAFTISSIASAILTQGVRIYLEPLVNAMREARPKVAAANEFQRPFSVLVMLGTLPLVLFPSWFVELLFTPAFVSVASVIFIFVVADCVFLCNQVYATVLMAVDDFRGFFLSHIVGYIVLCAGVWLLTSHYGLLGVAGSFIASRLVVFLLIQMFLGKRDGVALSPRTAALVGYVVAVLVISGWFFRVRPVAGAGDIFFRFGWYAAVAVGTFSFLTPAERDFLSGLYRRYVRAR
jgi:PST family polysaccharide transporter